jgi:colanic acid biosynthesis glycosyl transferase WcaI
MTVPWRSTLPEILVSTVVAMTASVIKTLVIGINYAPEMIGCSRYTADLVAYIAGPQARIEVVTAPPHYPGWRVQPPFKAWTYATETLPGVRVTRCPILMKPNGGGLWRLIAPMTFGLSVLPVVLWRALRLRPDVIVCVVPTLFAAPAAVLARRLTGARLIFHVQDLEVDAAFAVGHLNNRWLQRLGLAFERRMLVAADAVVSISKRMCERLAAKGVPAHHISLIRNWVDTKVIHPGGDGVGFRRRHGIDADAFVVMYAGHIGAKQAIDVLLQAAKRCRRDPRVRFVIAGDGPVKAPLMTEYANLDTVIWLPLQPEQQLCAMLSAADLHVLPQLRSTADLVLPSKLGGMLASGRPIVVAADPGTELAEFLEGAATLVPPGDPEAMADVLLDALDQRPADAARAARSQRAAQLERDVVLDAFHSLIKRHASKTVRVEAVQDEITLEGVRDAWQTRQP